MRVIVAGVPQEYADEFAIRLMEQGRAIPAPKRTVIVSESGTVPPVKTGKTGKARKRTEVTADELQGQG